MNLQTKKADARRVLLDAGWSRKDIFDVIPLSEAQLTQLSQQLEETQEALRMVTSQREDYWNKLQQAEADRELAIELLGRYMVAMDAVYNHNEAARVAVVQHFGTVHPIEATKLRAAIDEVRKR